MKTPEQYFRDAGLHELADSVVELEISANELIALNATELKKLFSIGECLAIKRYQKQSKEEQSKIQSSSTCLDPASSDLHGKFSSSIFLKKYI